MKAYGSEYLLPQSDSVYMTDSDIEGFSLQKLNYARNEIYARHGRCFQSVELTEYFQSRTWYVGHISPDDFDENILNECEKQNAKFLLEEEKRNNPDGYVLDRTGYDITAVEHDLDETDYGELDDGLYYGTMRLDLQGYPLVVGEHFLGTLYQYEIHDGEIIIHGSLNECDDEGQQDTSEEGYLKNGKRSIVCDENTQYFTSGGTGAPKEYTQEKFFQIIQETKDSGLGFIINIQDGVAVTITICS